MSLGALGEITKELPPKMAEDVMGYARSVKAALPEIFRDAGIREDRQVGERLVFVAGIRKIESLIASQYWTLDNSIHLMQRGGVDAIRVGSSEIAQGSRYYEGLRDTFLELQQILSDLQMTELIQIRSYSELARRLCHED